MGSVIVRKRTFLAVTKIAISFGLLVLLISQVSLPEILGVIQDSNLLLFIAATAISALTMLIRSIKWSMLLRIQGARLSLGKVHSLSYMAMFFNNFSLGSTGGDLFKIYRTIPYTTWKSGAISSVAMEKVTNLVAVAGLVFVFGLLNLYQSDLALWHVEINKTLTWAIIGSLVACGVIGAVLGAILYVGHPSGLPLLSRLPKSVKTFSKGIQSFNESVRIYGKHGSVVFWTFILTVIFFLVNILAMHVYALSANVEVGLLQLGFIVPAVFLIVMVPISINGIGLQEGAFFIYLESIGVDPASAVFVAVLPRIGMLIFSLVGGLLYMADSTSSGNREGSRGRKRERGT